jgi:hypothetical protein
MQFWQKVTKLSFHPFFKLLKLFKFLHILIFCNFLSIFTIFAQNIEVIITEISPATIGGEPEWVEFFIKSDEILDLSEWSISLKDKTAKIFKNIKTQLQASISPELNSLFKYNSKNGVYFFWEKSPISLPNNGAEIVIKNAQQQILATAKYPKVKYGQRKNYAYGEILNYYSNTNSNLPDLNNNFQYLPLIYRTGQFPNYLHSRGQVNLKLPQTRENLELLITEVSMNHLDHDFIELYVKSAQNLTDDKLINLKYLTIKHNGTILYKFESDFFVKIGDYLVFYIDDQKLTNSQTDNIHYLYSNVKTGLSGGSGTIEVILWQDTSLESTIDFICWQNEQLSKTENSRVLKNTKNWTGDCFDIHNFIPNQSLARNLANIDTNKKSDFFAYLNGSPGQANLAINHQPIAQITLQGNQQISREIPFSINLTAENSYDLDGQQDLKDYLWTINNVQFSTSINPSYYKITQAGNYLVELQVTDLSGQTSTAQLNIVANEITKKNNEELATISAKTQNLANNSKKIKQKSTWQVWQTQRIKNYQKKYSKKDEYKYHVSNNFFDEFLDKLPSEFVPQNLK